MPQALPIIAYYAASALATTAWAAVAGAAAALVTSVAVSARMRHMAAKASRAQWEASLRDRAVLVRSAEMPRSVTYGRVSISGALVYAHTFGSLSDRMLMVVALRPGHEINAVEEVFFGERSLGTLDVNGYPTSGPMVSTAVVIVDHASTANGATTRAVTVSFTPISLATTAATRAGETNPDNGPLNYPMLVMSVVGSVVTVQTIDGNGVALPNGTVINITYQRTVSTTDWIRCKPYLGTASQIADAQAVTDSGGEWTSNHRGRGVPVLYVWLKYNQDMYPSGVENIRAVVQGKKVYDPRTTTTVYSRNPALCARDYLTSPLGFACPTTEIDDTLVIAAANICDEQVQISTAPSVFQNRYTCDVDLSTEAARDENLQVLVAAMAGYAVYSQGKWRIYAGAYSAPSVTLDESALNDSESIVIQSRTQRSQLFNAVKGIFVSPENKWQPTDYPVVTNSTYETQDGSERMVIDLTLPATTDGWMAQRLAKIELERSRQAMTVRAAFNLRAYRVSAGDIIGLTLSRYGFSNKAFRVRDREFDLERGIVLTLREEASGVYDWNFGQATRVDLAPNTTLPSPWTLPTMNAITLASGTANALFTDDGTVQPRIKVSWTALTDSNVTQGGAIEIEWRQLPSSVWNVEAPASGDASVAYIWGVVEGYLYNVRARARNGVNVRSNWVYAYHTVAGDTTAPPQPATLECEELSDGTRVFDWSMTTAPLDLAGFELRYGVPSTAWGSMTVMTKAGPGVRGVEGQQPVAAGTYDFAIRAFDWTGNESAQRTLSNKLLGLTGKSTGGWAESLCPDPLLRDVPFWTENTYTQPGWYIEDSNGVNNTPFNIGVPRCATIWSGTFTGTGYAYMWSRKIPYSDVGATLRLRFLGWNGSNSHVGVVVRFTNLAGVTISDNGLVAPAGAGTTIYERQLTVPANTHHISFYLYREGGPAFSGAAAISEIKVDRASGTFDLLPGSVIDTMSTSLADGYRFGRYATVIDESTFYSQVDATLVYTPPVDATVLIDIDGIFSIEDPPGGSVEFLGGLVTLSTESISPAVAHDMKALLVPSIDSLGSISSSISFSRRFACAANTTYTFQFRGKRRPNLPGTRYNTVYGFRMKLSAYKR